MPTINVKAACSEARHPLERALWVIGVALWEAVSPPYQAWGAPGGKACRLSVTDIKVGARTEGN